MYVYFIKYTVNLAHAGKPFTRKDPCHVRIISKDKLDRADAISAAETVLNERWPNVQRSGPQGVQAREIPENT